MKAVYCDQRQGHKERPCARSPTGPCSGPKGKEQEKLKKPKGSPEEGRDRN